MTPVARESLAPALAPFGKSSTLPSEAYTSESVFRWELDHFFDRTWVCVGRAEDLRSPGDQRAAAVGLESALLTRDEEGGLHAFYNVCRHRGHELLETGCGTNQKFIRCPYHAWCYGLDGALAGAPGFGKLAGFDRDGYSLVPLRIVEWHGWLFANASGDAPAFGKHIGNLGELIMNHRPEELVAGARHDYEVAANWKVITENYHECYHCSVIHPEFSRVSPPTSSLNLEPEGLWVGGPMDLAEGTQTMSLSGESQAPTLPHLAEGQERKVYYFGLFPNLLLSVHPDYIMTHRLRPLAPDRTAIECEWLFSREAVEAEGFDPSYASDFWDITNGQDWRACEGVQRGASSRGYRQGPLSPEESTVGKFVAMIARGYLEGRITQTPGRASQAFQ